MAYEEILLGLIGVAIALMVVSLRQVSSLASQSKVEEANKVERKLEGLTHQARSLRKKMVELGEILDQAIEDYRFLREKLAASSEHSLDAFRKSLYSNLEAMKGLVRRVERNSDKVDRAAAEMERRLTAAVERHVGGTVGEKIEPLLDNLDKMIARLEARGASPFKTAKARILQYLKDRGNIGGKHTAWKRALGCLVGHERGIGNEAMEDLARSGLLVKKSTNYGVEIALNKNRLNDIQRVINGEDL
ncbi:MAG: hypothetical protein ACE5IJ_04570 [Thermoplasmata archaeon]